MTYYIVYECDRYDRGRFVCRGKREKMIDADTPEGAEERFCEHAKYNAIKNPAIVSVKTTSFVTYR
jgi:hypothetical protein